MTATITQLARHVPREVRDIVEQRAARLLTRIEARDMLSRLANIARFNANYADHPDSFNRWNNISHAATSRAALIV